MWCFWNGIRGTALERVCSATLCVSVLFCRDLAKLGYITLLDYFMCNDVNREGDLTSQSKALNKSGRYLDLLCHCAGADLPSTVRCSGKSTWCTSGKAGKAARLCTGTPTHSGNSNTAQRQRAAAALRLLLAASCATAAGHHSRCVREGLIAARQQNTRRNSGGSRRAINNQRRGSYVTTQSVLAPNHSDKSVLQKKKKSKMCWEVF